MLSATAVLTLALGGGALLFLTPKGTTPAQELEQTLEDATTKATDEARQVRDAVTGKKTAQSFFLWDERLNHFSCGMSNPRQVNGDSCR